MVIIPTLRGADELDAKLAAAPQGTQDIVDEGNAAAAPIVKRHVVKETPRVSGALQESEDVLVRGSELEFQAGMFYASYVRDGTTRTLANGREVTTRANDYPGRGVRNAEIEVVREFEVARDEFVREFD